jgi:hypothetical protein
MASKLKSAKVAVCKVYEINCPYCGESLESPVSGSHMWCEGDAKETGGSLICPSCSQKSALPRKPFDVLMGIGRN